MPDHIHVLTPPAVDATTAKCLQLIKGGFSFAVRKQFQGDVWHTGYLSIAFAIWKTLRTKSSTSSTTQPEKTILTTHTSTQPYKDRLDSVPKHLKAEVPCS